jgi:uncharacterized protein (TIGR03067 family)
MFTPSAVLALALVLPAADPPTDIKTELARWQGTWEVELQLIDGRETAAKDRRITRVVVKDDVWEAHFKDAADPLKGKIQIVLDGNTKGIDVTIGKTVMKAAYLMDGDRVVLRAGDPNDPRPKDFSTSTGSKVGGILIYKRVKK